MSAPPANQRPNTLTDTLAAMQNEQNKQVQNKLTAGGSTPPVFVELDETETVTDSVLINANLQVLSETETVTDSLLPIVGCTGFRLDSAGGGRCAFSLDANSTYGGGKLDF